MLLAERGEGFWLLNWMKVEMQGDEMVSSMTMNNHFVVTGICFWWLVVAFQKHLCFSWAIRGYNSACGTLLIACH